MRKLPVLAFGGLAMATVAAFFIIQHLKVTTPLITAVQTPFPTVIDPLGGGTCLAKRPDGVHGPVNFTRTSLSFSLLHQSDEVYVYVADRSGKTVATLASGLFMRAVPGLTRTFTWAGREQGGRPAAPGSYYVKVVLRRQARTIDITNSTGALAWIKVSRTSPCTAA